MIARLFDLLGWWLLLAIALDCLKPGLWRRGWASRAALAMLPVLLWMPIRGLSALAVLRGLFSGLSPGTVLALGGLALPRVFPARPAPFTKTESCCLPFILAAPALLFYPAALGLGPVDPYAWGYSGAPALPLAVGALSLAAWLSGWRLSAFALLLALCAWRLDLLASSNLWDYLFDPLLVFLALIVSGIRKIR
jgi:hypothetical protein